MKVKIFKESEGSLDILNDESSKNNLEIQVNEFLSEPDFNENIKRDIKFITQSSFMDYKWVTISIFYEEKIFNDPQIF